MDRPGTLRSFAPGITEVTEEEAALIDRKAATGQKKAKVLYVCHAHSVVPQHILFLPRPVSYWPWARGV